MIMRKRLYKLWYLITYRLIQPKLRISLASLSGDGIFIDIRYWLSRPDKINPKTTPYIITDQNQKLGLMHISKFGAIKSKLRKHTNTGILLFYNKNKIVSIGDKVTLYWDVFRVEIVLLK